MGKCIICGRETEKIVGYYCADFVSEEVKSSGTYFQYGGPQIKTTTTTTYTCGGQTKPIPRKELYHAI